MLSVVLSLGGKQLLSKLVQQQVAMQIVPRGSNDLKQIKCYKMEIVLLAAQLLCTTLQVLTDIKFLPTKLSISFLELSNNLGVAAIALFLYKALSGKYN